MANFNTYQTRQLYVAKKVESTAAGVDEAGDIYVGAVAKDGNVEGARMFFSYCNADGLLTRSDTIPVNNIVSFKKTTAADMATKLMKHTIAVDTNAVTLANLVGKTVTCTVNVHQVLSYDDSDVIAVAASFVGNSTNTASAAAFHKALAEAIVAAMPKRKYPYFKVFSNGTEVVKGGTATGSANGVVLVEAAQGYSRGKLSKEAFPLSVSFNLHGSNTEDVAWGTDTVAESDVTNNTVIPAVYKIADLEYFALGERGDIYRGSTWPNNYEPTYMIDLTQSYDMLSLEYFWQGGAENVQKSPRMIQIAGPAAVITSLQSAVEGFINPTEADPGE